MTPKDKAKQLIENFTFNCRECDDAKQCALICVDEIIRELGWASSLVVFGNQIKAKMDGNISYWEQVKKEIKLL
jgi:hypothetical protein